MLIMIWNGLLCLIWLISFVPDLVDASCTPFYTTFNEKQDSLFTPLDHVPSSYQYSSVEGLSLYLFRPEGKITKKNGTNDKQATGASLNSTFFNLYGKFSFEATAPRVAGIVTALVLISPEGNEIDIELLGGDPHHWQSNIFVPFPSDAEPLFGTFGGVHTYPNSGGSSAVDSTHVYAIDWNADRIIWSVDGKITRTLFKKDTFVDDHFRFPSHAVRFQLGIWDASTPVGTCEWGKGPVDWSTAPAKMRATFRSVRVECQGV